MTTFTSRHKPLKVYVDTINLKIGIYRFMATEGDFLPTTFPLVNKSCVLLYKNSLRERGERDMWKKEGEIIT